MQGLGLLRGVRLRLGLRWAPSLARQCLARAGHAGPLLALSSQIRFAEHLTRGEGTVTRAEQAQVFRDRRAAERVRNAMLQREKAPLAAAPAFSISKCALTGVAFPNKARDFERYMTRSGLGRSALSWLPGSGSTLRLALDQCVDCSLEQRGQIAARQHMARELSSTLDLGTKLGAGRELDAVARGGERLELRRACLGAWLGTGPRLTRAGRVASR